MIEIIKVLDDEAPVAKNSLYLIKKIESSEYYGFCYTEEEAQKYCNDDITYQETCSANQDAEYDNLSDFKMIFIVYPSSTKKICNSWFASQEEATEYINQMDNPDNDGFVVESLYYIEDVLEDEDTHSANIKK